VADIPFTARVTCRSCGSRLEVFETQSGAKTISVIALGGLVESSAKALEGFQPPDAGPEIHCPACDSLVDPAAPYRGTERPIGGR
jgi:hypothetical protein